MPLYVRARPRRAGEKSIFGPYDERRLLDIVRFARISSAQAPKRGRPRREVHWVCGRGAPTLLRVYDKGRRVFPREEKGDGAREEFRELRKCLARAKGRCKRGAPKRVTGKLLDRSKRLRKEFACPFR